MSSTQSDETRGIMGPPRRVPVEGTADLPPSGPGPLISGELDGLPSSARVRIRHGSNSHGIIPRVPPAEARSEESCITTDLGAASPAPKGPTLLGNLRQTNAPYP